MPQKTPKELKAEHLERIAAALTHKKPLGWLCFRGDQAAWFGAAKGAPARTDDDARQFPIVLETIHLVPVSQLLPIVTPEGRWGAAVPSGFQLPGQDQRDLVATVGGVLQFSEADMLVWASRYAELWGQRLPDWLQGTVQL